MHSLLSHYLNPEVLAYANTPIFFKIFSPNLVTVRFCYVGELLVVIVTSFCNGYVGDCHEGKITRQLEDLVTGRIANF